MVAPETVRMPTRLPEGSRLWMARACISEDVATGTAQASASCCWNSDRNPQLVVMPRAPSDTSSCAASMKAGSVPSAPLRTTWSGEAPRTTL